jgi:5-methylcytosine-specific restriction endonuclease McrA
MTGQRHSSCCACAPLVRNSAVTQSPRRVPRHACATPGCSNVTETARCTACEKKQQQATDVRRVSRSLRGYDDIHQRLRILCFIRDAWTCVDCGWMPDVVRDAALYGLDEPPQDVILEELRRRFNRNERHLHADHQIPIEQRPDLRRDLDNYQTRCNECHSAKTMRESAGKRVL